MTFNISEEENINAHLPQAKFGNAFSCYSDSVKDAVKLKIWLSVYWWWYRN